MIENKKKIYFADLLFLIAMTFVVGFPKPSVYKAIAIIAFFAFMVIQSIVRKKNAGAFLQCLWALAFFWFCRISRLWSVYPGAIEGVINNVQWSFMISVSVANYIRVYNFSVSDISKRMLFVGIIFLVDIILNGEYVGERFTVVIGEYALNENAFGQIAIGVASYMIYWSKKKNWKNISINVFAIAMIVIALISGSRKSLIAAAIYIVAFAMYEYPSKDMFRATGKVLAVVIVVGIAYWCVMNIEILYNAIGSRMESLFAFIAGDDEADGSAFTRANMIECALEMFRKKPMLGYGLNTFEVISGFHTYSHNNYVELLANIGLVGLLIYYIPILVYLKRAIVLWRKRILDSIFPVGVIVVFFINDLFGVSYFSMQIHLFLGLAIGIVANFIERKEVAKKDKYYNLTSE